MTRGILDIVLAGVLLVVFLGTATLSAGMQWQAAVLPIMLAVLGLLLAAALLLKLAKSRHDTRPSLYSGEASSFAWFIFCVLAILLAGFQIGGAVFALAYFRWSAGFLWVRALIFALPVPLVFWLAFDKLLDRPEFPGLLRGLFQV